ncbi:MAG: hypothetical protein L6Q98_17985 [Anaerolineae bacterium]|nr:hypothetical protein [Anaerolineae bacterium]NUQ06171.1 hypothetical protein [Anaerolineae bacterium]
MIASWFDTLHVRRWLTLVVILFLLIGVPAQAAVFTPGCTAGVGDAAALQSAVTLASLNAQVDTISLAAGCTYTLTATLTVAADAGNLLSVVGNGAILSGDDTFRVFTVNSGANVTIDGVTIRDGAAADGAGIASSGTLTVTDSSIRDNAVSGKGGGIYVSGGTLTLTNSTVANNSAASGGGVNNQATAALNNSTLSGNAASTSGGGLSAQGTTTLHNTIIANSSGGDCAGAVTASHSLVEGGGCGVINGVSGNKTGDPALSALTGSPAYHTLQMGSLAIDMGDNALIPVGVTTDQAGSPRIVNGVVDMGAYESRGFVGVSPAAQDVSEGGEAVITFSRTGNNSIPLIVDFSRGGTASYADYTLLSDGSPLLSDQVTFAEGITSVNVTMSVGDDIPAEADETVVLTVTAASAFDLGTVSVSTTTILQNDLVVTVPTSDGAGSLRQAVLNANAFPTDDTITFSGVATVNVAGNHLNVANNGSLTIEGEGILINGTDTTTIFQVAGSAVVIMNDVTLADGIGGNGGALFNSGTLTLNNSTVSGNSALDGGGGIYNSASGTLTLNNSTIGGNSAFVGGGISNSGTVTLNNSTISGNSAFVGGGGLSNYGTLVLNNSTVADNSATNFGGGVRAAGTQIIRNSIIANNASGTSDDCGQLGIVTIDVDNSLVEDGGCGVINGVDGNKTGDPALGALTGSPAYYPLLPGSIAINAGSNALIPPGMTTDQVGRPRILNTTVDMGSYEYAAATLLTVQLTLQGRPPAPNAQWASTVHVQIRPQGGGTPYLSGDFTANTSGIIGFLDLYPGTYDLWIKGTHTLARLHTITLVEGGNILTTSVLQEGDANDSNSVTIADFSILAAAFGSSVGQALYNPQANFNGDAAVNISDFSLLAANFTKIGEGGGAP